MPEEISRETLERQTIAKDRMLKRKIARERITVCLFFVKSKLYMDNYNFDHVS